MSSQTNGSGAWLPADKVLRAALGCMAWIESTRIRLRDERVAELIASRWHPLIRTEAKARAYVEREQTARYINGDQEAVAWRLQALARQLPRGDTIYVTGEDYQRIWSFYEELGTPTPPSQPQAAAA